jgi:hypothetical protein
MAKNEVGSGRGLFLKYLWNIHQKLLEAAFELK